jgi:hypothetical protein
VGGNKQWEETRKEDILHQFSTYASKLGRPSGLQAAKNENRPKPIEDNVQENV